jgi:murein DD-endopeptidase MepM/ murein hydrolase activator NlpD
VQGRQHGTYRGRRRLPKLPSRRYAAVVTTAFLGAGLVALGAGAVIPDSMNPAAGKAGDTQAMAVEDRLNALDKANRSQDRPGPALSVDLGAPDVWLLPIQVQFQITTVYEMRWGEFHWGVDMAAPYGTPIYAAHAGTVSTAGVEGGYGNCVRIDHGEGVETVYGHASKILVQEGEKVQAGQMIALVGSTGYSTGNHLHFEVNVNGEHKNPMTYLLQRGVDIAKRLEAATGGTVIG